MAVDLERGRAILAEWAPKLAEATPKSLRGVSIDKLALALIGLVQGLTEDGHRARFDALVAHGWSIDALDEIEPLCLAILACVEELATIEVSATGARLPADLQDEAPALRARMMKVLRYWFADDAAVNAQLDDIRSGTGYRDLALDLGRLAELYKAHSATLAADTHLYDAADATRARALSNSVLDAIALTAEDQRVLKQDQLRRLFALLDARYAEMRAAGRFLLRDADGDARFPGVRVLSR